MAQPVKYSAGNFIIGKGDILSLQRRVSEFSSNSQLFAHSHTKPTTTLTTSNKNKRPFSRPIAQLSGGNTAAGHEHVDSQLRYSTNDCVPLCVITLIYRIIVQQNFILFLEFSNLHSLIPSCTFIRFWKNHLPTRLFNHRLLLWNLRVGRLFFHPTRSYSILHVYCFWQKFPSYTFIPSYRFIRDSKVHIHQRRYVTFKQNKNKRGIFS